MSPECCDDWSVRKIKGQKKKALAWLVCRREKEDAWRDIGTVFGIIFFPVSLLPVLF